MRRRPYDIKTCMRCRFRGFLDYESQLCCNYLWITGKARILLPKREDGRCPAFEEGEQEFSQITQISMHVPKDRPMYKDKYLKDQMRNLYDQGLNDRQIAVEMGCNEKTVASWRRKEGLPAVGAKKKEQWYDPELLQKMYDMGYSDSRMSRQTGIHPSVIANWRREHNLPILSKGGKEPVFDRDRMRELYDQGLFDSQIAALVGCTQSAVRHWRQREGLKAQTKREDLE